MLLDGRPTIFDGIEFNDRIACTDVLYDLAFLLMDLWRRRLPRHAKAVWNGYLTEVGNVSGASLLPLFLSCRAAVRAKTSATAARLQPEARRREDSKVPSGSDPPSWTPGIARPAPDNRLQPQDKARASATMKGSCARSPSG